MKYVTPPKIQQIPPRKTRHARPGLSDLTLVGSHLYEVTAMAPDGQATSIVVAADGELEARAGFMIVQTAPRPHEREVKLTVRRINAVEEV